MVALSRLSVPVLGALLAAGCTVAPPDLAPEKQLEQRLGSAIVVQVAPSPRESADGPSGPTLNLAQAVGTALRNDARLQSALARYRVALAEAKQERLLPNPVLNLIVRFPEGGGKPILDTELTADLVSLLQRPGKIGAADHRLRAASAEVLSVALDTVQQTQETFTRMQTLSRQMPLLEARKQLLGRLLALAEARLQAGEATSLDVSTLRSHQVELELEISRQREQLRQQELAMARLLGRPGDRAQWELIAALSGQNVEQLDETALISTALEHRPDLQARQWELAALGGDLRAARLAFLDGARVGADVERDDGWSAGPIVSVPLPLFDWGQAQREAIRARRSEAAHALTEASRLAVQEVRQALAALKSADAIAARVQRELLPLVERRQVQAELEYRSGLADVTALVLAEQELQSARMQLAQVQGDAALAEIRLRRACGGILPAPVPPAPLTPATTQDASR